MRLLGLAQIHTEYGGMVAKTPCDELTKHKSKFNSFQLKLDQRKFKV